MDQAIDSFESAKEQFIHISSISFILLTLALRLYPLGKGHGISYFESLVHSNYSFLCQIHLESLFNARSVCTYRYSARVDVVVVVE